MTSRVCRALSAFVLFVGAVSLLPGSARADVARSDSRPVEVGIGQVSPQIPDFANTSKTMTFAGQIRNTGTSPLRDIHLELQRNWVSARSDLGSADGAGYTVATKKFAELATGAPRSWNFSLTEKALFGFNSPHPGVYSIDVDAYSSDKVFLGGQRTYVVWDPAKARGAKEARLALMWPVVGQPGLTGQKKADSSGLPIVLDQSTAQQFAKGQRLDRILDDAGSMTVNYLLDPDVLYTAKQLAGGYFYTDKNNKQIGAPGTDPQYWYSKASSLFATQRNCWNLLDGDPDLNTLSRTTAGKDLLTAAASVPAGVTAGACPQSGQPTIAWPSDGQADAATLAAIAQTKAPNLVTLLGSNEVSSWPSAHASLPNSPNTVVYDNYLSSVFADAAKPAAASLNNAGVLEGQIWLAQTALAAQDNTDRILVVAPPRDFDPAPDLLKAINAEGALHSGDQWFALENLGKVLSAPASRERLSALTKIATPNLPTATVNSAFDSQQLYQSLHSIMPGHEYDGAVSFRPVATWWRNHGGDPAYGKTVYDTAVTDHGLVSFGQQTPPLTMSGKSGTVPVAIDNRTNATIRIYLRVEDQGAHTMSLKVSEDQGGHTIGQGQTATIRIPVEAEGNGQQVRLVARLFTCKDITVNCTYYPSHLITQLKENGGLTTVTVKVSRIGIIALALIIGSGMLLILLIGLRVYRAKRAHHAPVQDTMAS